MPSNSRENILQQCKIPGVFPLGLEAERHRKAWDYVQWAETILEQIRTRWQEVVQQPLFRETSPIARLETLFACYLELFTEAPDICLFLQRILLEQHKESSPRVARVFGQTARFISRILDQGKAQGVFRADLDSLVTAHMILGSLSGLRSSRSPIELWRSKRCLKKVRT